MDKLNIIPYNELRDMGVEETKKHLLVYRQLPIDTNDLVTALGLSKSAYLKLVSVFKLPRKPRIDGQKAEEYSVSYLNGMITKSLEEIVSVGKETEAEEVEDERSDVVLEDEDEQLNVDTTDKQINDIPHIAMYLAGESPFKLSWEQLGLQNKHVECVAVCDRRYFSVAYSMITSTYVNYNYLRTDIEGLSYIVAYLR